MGTFEKLWGEINEPEGYVSTMAKEKGLTSLLRGEVFSKGTEILRDLAKTHFSRPKPSLLARIFRTKEAKEYKAEREEMNRIAKQLNEISNNAEMIVYSKVGKANGGITSIQAEHEPVQIDYMIRDRESFATSSKQLDDNVRTTRGVFEQKLNAKEPFARDTKEQIILDFLGELDKKTAAAQPANDVPQTEAETPDPAFNDQLKDELDSDVPAPEDTAAVNNEPAAQKGLNG